MAGSALMQWRTPAACPLEHHLPHRPPDLILLHLSQHTAGNAMCTSLTLQHTSTWHVRNITMADGSPDDILHPSMP